MNRADIDIIRNKGEDDPTKIQLYNNVQKEIIDSLYIPLFNVFSILTRQATISNIINGELKDILV